MKITEVNSNYIFFLTILSSAYKSECIYMILAIAICVASYAYHYAKLYNNSKTTITRLRLADIVIAIACYMYMAYFISTYIDIYHLFLYASLIITIILFIIGKTRFGKLNNMHSYFHIAIGIVSSVIVLMK